MVKALLKRILHSVPTLIGVSLVAFLLIRLVPGDPVLLTLTTADYFAAYAIQLAAAFPPIDPPPP